MDVIGTDWAWTAQLIRVRLLEKQPPYQAKKPSRLLATQGIIPVALGANIFDYSRWSAPYRRAHTGWIVIEKMASLIGLISGGVHNI